MSSNKKKFDIGNNFDSMFKPTSPNNNLKRNPVVNINIEKLVPFTNHPFKLYEGERFADMVESIKSNGIIIPIIVRPLDDATYEILSGHNRVEAAKYIGFETIPATIREHLNEDEALLIVTETNLIQRSFTDLSHSERAAVLAIHHEAIRNQGKRTDLINEIENLLKSTENISNSEDSETCGQFVHKLKSREKIANDYGLNYKTVARYLRIYNNLSENFNDLLNSGQLPFIAALELSYMSSEYQSTLTEVLSKNPKLKIDIKKSKLLREFSESKKLTPKMIEDILSGVAFKKKNRPPLPVQSLKLNGKLLSKYFKSEQTPEEIKIELIEALEFFRAHKNISGD